MNVFVPIKWHWDTKDPQNAAVRHAVQWKQFSFLIWVSEELDLLYISWFTHAVVRWTIDVDLWYFITVLLSVFITVTFFLWDTIYTCGMQTKCCSFSILCCSFKFREKTHASSICKWFFFPESNDPQLSAAPGSGIWLLRHVANKKSPRGGNLTFPRCPGVGNLTLASMKMSKSPGSARPPPPPPWGLTLIGA